MDIQKDIDKKIEWCEDFQEEVEHFSESLDQMCQRTTKLRKEINNWEKENGK